MRYALYGLTLALLAGCSQGEVKENLGLVREAPDEFRVVSRPPLSVPREFFLTPPTPGAERAFGLSAEAQARDLVTGGRSGEGDTPIAQREAALASAEEALDQRQSDIADAQAQLAQAAAQLQALERLRKTLKH